MSNIRWCESRTPVVKTWWTGRMKAIEGDRFSCCLRCTVCWFLLPCRVCRFHWANKENAGCFTACFVLCPWAPVLPRFFSAIVNISESDIGGCHPSCLVLKFYFNQRVGWTPAPIAMKHIVFKVIQIFQNHCASSSSWKCRTLEFYIIKDI